MKAEVDPFIDELFIDERLPVVAKSPMIAR